MANIELGTHTVGHTYIKLGTHTVGHTYNWAYIKLGTNTVGHTYSWVHIQLEQIKCGVQYILHKYIIYLCYSLYAVWIYTAYPFGLGQMLPAEWISNGFKKYLFGLLNPSAVNPIYPVTYIIYIFQY